jgi:hypothetical protein
LIQETRAPFGRLASSGACPITLPPQNLGVLELGRVGSRAGFMQYKPSERNRELALYSRLPSAKRAFITRWKGRVKPIKKVETVAFPVWAKNHTRRDHPTSRRGGDKALPEADKALGVPHPCRVLCDRACPERSRRGGDFDFLDVMFNRAN